MMQSIYELGNLLRDRRISPVEITRECLKRIETHNPSLNAFIAVTAESALAQAAQAEGEIMRGDWRGPLHGVPIALKDLIDFAGVPTTTASNLFKDRIPTKDADVVTRLKDGGAVLLGKNNLHECAYGGSSVISAYGPVRNAWNTNCIAGGSSGGSATAVAAGLCYGAVGTDTAGSIREPAALCGIVGFKPTFGLVSVQGIFPLSPSLDHAGPITRTVSDAAIMYQALRGTDSASADFSWLDHLRRGLRVAVARNFFFDDLDSEIESAINIAIAHLSSLIGSDVREISLDVPTDRTLQLAESFATHAEYVAKSPELYQPATLLRIRAGENITPAEIDKAREELNLVRLKICSVFDDVDLIITPTTPIPAPRLDFLLENPEELRPREIMLLRNTRPFNMWGLPAISVPCGFTQSGLPIGLQIAAAHGAERLLLQMAQAYEQATEWHKKQPTLAN
jgi:aspartyl-tRNA(Asn)/glutamyl-tRNA(Gln) amidotransferase subunit A